LVNLIKFRRLIHFNLRGLLKIAQLSFQNLQEELFLNSNLFNLETQLKFNFHLTLVFLEFAQFIFEDSQIHIIELSVYFAYFHDVRMYLCLTAGFLWEFNLHHQNH
jgi:hypothetical protein